MGRRGRRGSRRRNELLDWWIRRLEILKGETANTPKAIDIYWKAKNMISGLDDVIGTSKPWAGIKLGLLSFYIGVYSTAIKSYLRSRSRGRICYVDTFSGPGLVRIPKKRGSYTILYGSPLLGMIVPRAEGKGFRMMDKFIFIEKDREKASVLKYISKLVASYLGVPQKAVVVFPGVDMNDINYRQQLIVKHGCSHSLVFIDPYGTEPRWATVSSILDLPTDVLINFMIAGIRRHWGTYKGKEDQTALDLFFGGPHWRYAASEDDLLGLYVNNIKDKGRIVLTLKVTGFENFYYYIILATRRTSGNNPWLEPVEKRLKPKIEKTTGDTLRHIIAILEGDLWTIDRFF